MNALKKSTLKCVANFVLRTGPVEEVYWRAILRIAVRRNSKLDSSCHAKRSVTDQALSPPEAGLPWNKR
jgi:hypothetical protein